MALFGFGKKKEEKKKAPTCSCSCNCPVKSTNDTANERFSDLKEGEIRSIKVLGSGCKSCHELYENAMQAVKDMGLPVQVEYITNMQKIMEYGVMSMPVLVVNERVVTMGKVLKAGDIIALLRKMGV